MKTRLILLLFFILVAQTSAGTHDAAAFEVEVHGSGPAMFLIPGASCSGSVWRQTVEKYRTTHKVHVLTLAGYAGVPPLKSDSILPVIKDSLARYIRQNKTEHSVLIGHSIGGFLAMWLTAENDHLVDKIIIVDALPFLACLSAPQMTEAIAKNAFAMMKTYYMNLDSTTLAMTQRMAIKSMLRDENHLDELVRQPLRSDRRTLGVTMYELMTTDLREKIAAIQTPGLVLTGWPEQLNSADNTKLEVKLNSYRQQYALWEKARVVAVGRSSHFIMLDNPAGFFAAVDAFLAQ